MKLYTFTLESFSYKLRENSFLSGILLSGATSSVRYTDYSDNVLMPITTNAEMMESKINDCMRW